MKLTAIWLLNVAILVSSARAQTALPPPSPLDNSTTTSIINTNTLLLSSNALNPSTSNLNTSTNSLSLSSGNTGANPISVGTNTSNNVGSTNITINTNVSNLPTNNLVPINTNISGTAGDNTTVTNGSNGNTSTNLSTAAKVTFDQRFLTNAAAQSLYEIALGELAQTNSQNTNVQALAVRIVADQTLIYQQAQDLAAALSLTAPAQLSPSQERSISRFARLSDAKFDSAYIKRVVIDQTKNNRKYEKAARKAQDPDVRAFARTNLPVIVDDLVLALDILETFR